MATLTLERGLSGLSAPQQEAVYHEGGPLLIVSGAGSGKTRTLTYRAARLVQSGTPPQKILIVTFTNRAANEFRERTAKLMGPAARDIWMSTLHSAGARILRQYGIEAGFPAKFKILSESQSTSLVIRATAQLEINRDLCPAPLVLQQITAFKERLWTPDQVDRSLHQRSSLFELEVAAIYRRYQEILEKEESMDFADLIFNTVRLLEKAPTVARRLGLWHILVDEYQDTDPGQSRMLQLLLPPQQNLTAVGDVDQAIYGFRGADPTIMLNFRAAYPGAKVVRLGQNYRSTKAIVEAAAAVIQVNKQRIQHRIWSERETGYPIILATATDPEDEAARVVAQCIQLRTQTQVPYSELAVLFRINAQGQALEEQFFMHGLPYHLSGTRFFDRTEVADALGFLRLLHDPSDLEALERIINKPARCITRHTLDALLSALQPELTVWDLLADPSGLPITAPGKRGLKKFYQLMLELREHVASKSLPELLQTVLNETGLGEHYAGKEAEERGSRSPRENLERLLLLCQRQFKGPASTALPALLQYLQTLNAALEGGDAVQLLTVHAAKGTEFRTVFVVGCEDGMLPYWRAVQAEDPLSSLEEERRLFYVAMTRAKEVLYLYRCQTRLLPSGDLKRCLPSRFLEELPAGSILHWK
jgi:DNA helicase-2/ATP-dependent DNA helicase PcrA